MSGTAARHSRRNAKSASGNWPTRLAARVLRAQPAADTTPDTP